MKILIVDDSKTMRMIVGRTLKKAGFDGHTVLEAGNGEEALDVIKSSSPDVVLADWNMPTMSGIELLQKVREEGINMPFGFVTSEGTPAVREQAMAAGASFHITKPFTPDMFQVELSSVLS